MLTRHHSIGNSISHLPSIRLFIFLIYLQSPLFLYMIDLFPLKRTFSMNTIDFFILATMGITALIGVSRGFIRELSSIMAWILACIATFWDIPLLSGFMRSHFESVFIANIVAGILVFVIAFIIVSLIGTLCAGFVRGTFISPIDRLFGSIVGGVKGFIIISCVELAAVCFIARDEMPAQIQQSNFMPYVYNCSDWIRSILPFKIRHFLDELTYKNGSIKSNSMIEHQNEPAKETKTNEVSDKLKELSTLTPKASEEIEANYTPNQKDKLNQLIETTH